MPSTKSTTASDPSNGHLNRYGPLLVRGGGGGTLMLDTTYCHWLTVVVFLAQSILYSIRESRKTWSWETMAQMKKLRVEV
jgi:hypothetical protein